MSTCGKGMPGAVCFRVTFFCKCKIKIIALFPGKVNRTPCPSHVKAARSADGGCQLWGRPVLLGLSLASRGLQECDFWGSHLLRSLISVSDSLSFPMCRSLTSFARFSAKHILFVVSTVNGTVFKFQFPFVHCNHIEAERIVLHSSCTLQSRQSHLEF